MLLKLKKSKIKIKKSGCHLSRLLLTGFIAMFSASPALPATKEV